MDIERVTPRPAWSASHVTDAFGEAGLGSPAAGPARGYGARDGVPSPV